MMLTCEDVNNFLVAYLDDDIPDNLRRRYEAHVARCEVCSAYLSQYRSTMRLTRESDTVAVDLPEELVEMTLSFLNEHQKNGQ
jgi:anti-sigma factor RsiW